MVMSQGAGAYESCACVLCAAPVTCLVDACLQDVPDHSMVGNPIISDCSCCLSWAACCGHEAEPALDCGWRCVACLFHRCCCCFGLAVGSRAAKRYESAGQAVVQGYESAGAGLQGCWCLCLVVCVFQWLSKLRPVQWWLLGTIPARTCCPVWPSF